MVTMESPLHSPLRSPLHSAVVSKWGADAYAVLGFSPELVIDAVEDYYRANSAATTFADMVTFSRASGATYTDSSGVLQTAASGVARTAHHIYNGTSWVKAGLLVEPAATNVQDYSNPTSSTWTPLAGTITNNAAVGIGGLTNAARYTADGTSAAHRIGRNATITGNACFSYFIRKDSTHRYVQLLQASDATFFQNFDLQAGTKGTGGAGVANSGVQDCGDFWRIFAAFNVVTSASALLYLVPSASATYGQFSSSSDYIDISETQIEAGLIPTSQIPTSGSTATRAAETVTVAAAKVPYPTAEVIGSELVTNGTFDTDTTGWSVTAGNGTIVSSGGEVLGTCGSTGLLFSSAITTEVGKVYRLSVDGRRGTFTDTLQVGFSNTSTGIPSPLVEFTNSAPNQTKEAVFTATATTTYVNVRLAAVQSGNTVYLDNVSVQEINPLSLWIQMEGYMTYADENSFNPYFWRWYLDTSNYIQSALDHTSTRTGSPRFFQNAAGTVDQVAGLDAYTPSVNVPFNIASRHGSTFVNGAVDGTALTEDTTPVALAALSSTNLQLAYSGGPMIISKFRMGTGDPGDSGIELASS